MTTEVYSSSTTIFSSPVSKMLYQTPMTPDNRPMSLGSPLSPLHMGMGGEDLLNNLQKELEREDQMNTPSKFISPHRNFATPIKEIYDKLVKGTLTKMNDLFIEQRNENRQIRNEKLSYEKELNNALAATEEFKKEKRDVNITKKRHEQEVRDSKRVLQAQIEEERQVNSKKNKEIAALRLELNSLRDGIDPAMKAKLDNVIKLASAQGQEVAKLNRRLRENEESLSNLQVESEIPRLESKVQQVRKLCRKVQQDLSSQRRVACDLRAENKKLRSKLTIGGNALSPIKFKRLSKREEETQKSMRQKWLGGVMGRFNNPKRSFIPSSKRSKYIDDNFRKQPTREQSKVSRRWSRSLFQATERKKNFKK
jgi:hypothetical protein